MKPFGILTLLVGSVFLFTGCSVFSSPRPNSAFHLERSLPVTMKDGARAMQPFQTIKIHDEWMAGTVSLELSEDFASENGAEHLKNSRLVFSRSSDISSAAEVARHRADASAQVAREVVQGLLSNDELVHLLAASVGLD